MREVSLAIQYQPTADPLADQWRELWGDSGPDIAREL